MIQILLVGVLVVSHDMSHSLCVIGVYDEMKMMVPMIVRYVHSYSKKNVTLPPFQEERPHSKS
jgi:hypothetical protein